MTDRELDQLERDAKRPNYGGRYYPPSIVLALIAEVRKARGEQTPTLFDEDAENKESEEAN